MMKHTRRRLLGSVLLAIGVVLYARSAAAQPKYSLVIGVDGLGYGEHGLLVAQTPTIDRVREGSWAEGYRSAYAEHASAGGALGTPTQQRTISGPGWATILSGVWIDRHAVEDNGFGGADFENNPTYLETLEASVPDIVSVGVVNWRPIDRFILATVDDADTAMDHRAGLADDELVTDMAREQIALLPADLPGAVFVHLDDVDHAGHQHGGSSAAYRASIELADRRIGLVLDAVRQRQGFGQEDWQLIIVSDHGHTPRGGHGGQSELERRIPLYVSSRSLRPGALDGPDAPGGAPVTYADVAPTVLAHFGLALPEHYAGVSHAAGLVVIDE